MEAKPIITYAGKWTLFEEVREAITAQMSAESCQWKRSHGRSVKAVHVDANWIRFVEENVTTMRETLLNRQYLHTYWTDCGDVDEYKMTVKNDIVSWMNKLKLKNAWDWMIVVVEENAGRSTPAKTTSKLLKSTVWDRIKQDFPSKNIERVGTLVHSGKTEARSAGVSVDILVQQIRVALLHALNREIGYYEEKLREKRESRNQVGWSFVDFYFMQEQLAFVLESMTLYQEALVQYDELDALLTQFIINAANSESPAWLQQLAECKSSWTALCLKNTAASTHQGFLQKNGSLLDLRSHLFLRICNILILLCRPWEMAQRALPYIQNAVVELKTLGVKMACEGAMEAWALAGFLEILLVSERYNDSSQVESYSLHTAQLWAHARLKMEWLGELCGLMPHMTPSSQQIHLVVSILSGFGDDLRAGDPEMSPSRRISESLSSKESFVKHYKDVCEIAMGTFKYVGRIRSARLIGKDLADFYLDKDEPQMAVQFLQDLLKMYIQEQWTSLAVLTQKKLLRCYEQLSYELLYMHTALLLATNNSLKQTDRRHYFEQVLTTKNRLAKNKSVTFSCDGVFSIQKLEIKSDSSICTLSSNIVLRLTISSNLLAEVKMKKIIVPCESVPEDCRSTPKRLLALPAGRKAQPSIAVQQIAQSNSIGIVCCNQHQVLSRQDSASSVPHSSLDVTRIMSDINFIGHNIYVALGTNVIELPIKGTGWGKFEVKQICAEWDQLCFVEDLTNSVLKATISIVQEACAIEINCSANELIAGFEQTVTIHITAGSRPIRSGSTLKLESRSEHNIHLEHPSSLLVDEVIDPFCSWSSDIHIRSNFNNQVCRDPIMHELSVTATWEKDCEVTQSLGFTPPFMTTHKLHTCESRKFVQLEVLGLSDLSIIISQLQLNSPLVSLSDIGSQPTSSSISSLYPTSFVWMMQNVGDDDHEGEIPFHFQLEYNRSEYQEKALYVNQFSLNSIKTLFTVHMAVESANQGHCKVDTVCNLNINITNLGKSEYNQLYYEVMADNNMWALLGKASDMFSFDGTHDVFNCSVEMKPLVRGYLPIPSVRLLRYGALSKKGTTKVEDCKLKLIPVPAGQVYNWSGAAQAHVPTASHP